MATVLQDTLRGLCGKSGWCYAVFWKLKQRTRMILTWEDGYYDPATAASSTSTENSDIHVFGGCSPSDEIGVLVSKMSYHVYSLGEGIIGRVAFSQKHQWVFAGGGRTAAEKYPTGWTQQFTAGIKTIAVIAVPDGVLQLGSVQTVTEDMKLVLRVQAIFHDLHCIPGVFFSDLLPKEKSSLPLNLPPHTGVPPLLNVAPHTLVPVATLPPYFGLQHHNLWNLRPVHQRQLTPLKRALGDITQPKVRESIPMQTSFIDTGQHTYRESTPLKSSIGNTTFPVLGRVQLSRFSANAPAVTATTSPATTSTTTLEQNEVCTTLQPIDDIGDCTDWDLSCICDNQAEEVPTNTFEKNHEDNARKRARLN